LDATARDSGEDRNLQRGGGRSTGSLRSYSQEWKKGRENSHLDCSDCFSFKGKENDLKKKGQLLRSSPLFYILLSCAKSQGEISNSGGKGKEKWLLSSLFPRWEREGESMTHLISGSSTKKKKETRGEKDSPHCGWEREGEDFR